MSETLTHFIGGEAVGSETSGESLNPSNLDDVVARYPKANAGDVDAAARAARAAFPAWSEASPEEPSRQARPPEGEAEIVAAGLSRAG